MRRVGTFDFLKNIDNFSEALPSFNINGRSDVKTFFGGIMSLSIIMVTIAFGVMKMQHLVERKNPQINTNDAPLEDGTTYHTGNEDFMWAFAAERYDNFEGLSDPRYIKWVTAYWIYKDNVWDIKWFPMHQCTDAKQAKFFPPQSEQFATKMKNFFEQGHLYCIDFNKFDIEIYGASTTGVDYAAFDVLLVPCGS